MKTDFDHCILFLNCRYERGHDGFYLKSMQDKSTFAVDGGIRFFLQNEVKPDILIGDFDSLPELPEDYLSGIEVIEFPSRKDKTDSQLALETAISRGARQIEICGAVAKTEIDHVLGNIFLLDLINRYNDKNRQRIRGKITEPRQDIYLVSNGRIRIDGRPGNYLSIIPVVKKIWIDFDGLEYPSPSRWIKFGETLPLRNRLVGEQVTVTVKGKAVIVLLRD